MNKYTRFSPKDYDRAIGAVNRAQEYISDILTEKFGDVNDERGIFLDDTRKQLDVIIKSLRDKQNTFTEATDPILAELVACDANRLTATRARMAEATRVNITHRALRELLGKYYGDRVTNDCFPREADLLINIDSDYIYLRPICDGRVFALYISNDEPVGLWVYQRYDNSDPMYDRNVSCALVTAYNRTNADDTYDVVDDAINVCRYINEHPSVNQNDNIINITQI